MPPRTRSQFISPGPKCQPIDSKTTVTGNPVPSVPQFQADLLKRPAVKLVQSPSRNARAHEKPGHHHAPSKPEICVLVGIAVAAKREVLASNIARVAQQTTQHFAAKDKGHVFPLAARI